MRRAVVLACIAVFALATTAGAGPDTYRNKKQGFTVEIPLGWERGDGYGDLLMVDTVGGVHPCDDEFPPRTSVRVREIRGPASSGLPRRPASFGAEAMPAVPVVPVTGTPACPDATPSLQELAFRDKGRAFEALVLVYPEATEQDRVAAFEILNSLEFVSARKLDRKPAKMLRPLEIRVLVLDSTGTENAAAVKANELRGLAYAIAGAGTAPAQQGTTVGCRIGFEREAKRLASTVDDDTTVVPFPSPRPAGHERSDCIVTLGT